MALAVGEFPNKPAVYGSKREVTLRRQGPCTADILKQPMQFGCGKIGINTQTGSRLHHVLSSVLAQLRAGRLGASVLPHDGVVDDAAITAVPHDGGLALVGDTKGCDISRVHTTLSHHVCERGHLAIPNDLWVMLDPTRFGINLRKLLLCQLDYLPATVKQYASRARGSLVYC